MTRVCVLDYGSGNVRSVYNLFAALSASVVVSSTPSDIADASHVVLPGVGAFGAAMQKMCHALPLDDLRDAVLVKRKPFLGICVGMQVLATQGDEFGSYAGLGWIPGTVRRVDHGSLPLPHIGWNNIVCQHPSPLLAGLEHEPDFYFVHSYAFWADDPRHMVATTEYGENFCSVLQRDNLFGVQFHPEKSQRAGLQLAKNFLSYP